MKKQILAVDDSKAIRFLLQTVLGGDYQVVTVPDGHSAMYYLSHREQPDVIIVDPQLPDMEDWELVEQLSTSGMHGNVPVIVLSGLDRHETSARCLELGIRKYFMKPFNPVELLEDIRMLQLNGALDKDLKMFEI